LGFTRQLQTWRFRTGDSALDVWLTTLARTQAAVFNASGGFKRKPFLELTEAEFTSGYNVSVRGAFLFSQAALPLLLAGVEQGSTHPPSLIFTGATASVKSNALMSSFSGPKFALRAMSASLAKEFGPKGVHVGHAIIDGVIDLPQSKEYMKDAGPDAKISPDAVSCCACGWRVWVFDADVVRLRMRTGIFTRSPSRPSPGRLISGRLWRSGKRSGVSRVNVQTRKDG
jgi:NAD(P)-dependent dehydrogenase (short-subunit alcohol dehydrogenase family)